MWKTKGWLGCRKAKTREARGKGSRLGKACVKKKRWRKPEARKVRELHERENGKGNRGSAAKREDGCLAVFQSAENCAREGVTEGENGNKKIKKKQRWRKGRELGPVSPKTKQNILKENWASETGWRETAQRNITPSINGRLMEYKTKSATKENKKEIGEGSVRKKHQRERGSGPFGQSAQKSKPPDGKKQQEENPTGKWLT